MRVNLGCGTSYRDGWVNVDASPDVRADVYADAFDFVRDHGAEVDELYMGHFLEHLLPATAVALLALVRDRLPAGSVVSAVVPDMRAIFAAYEAGEITNRELNERFVYSYEQPSHHVWCYDVDSLTRVFAEAGLDQIEAIDPLTWEPVHWKEGPESRWQCGVRAVVPAPDAVPWPPEGPSIVARYPPEAGGASELPVTADEILLHRIAELRAQLAASAPAAPAVPPPPAAPPPPGSAAAPPSDGPGGAEQSARARIRAAASARLPAGSRGRDLARLGMATYRDAREMAGRTKAHWRQWGVPLGTSVYAWWHRSHDATRAELAFQRSLAGRASSPVAVHAVVVADGGSGLPATLRSLQRQSWPHWNATVIGSQRELEVVDRLEDDRVRFRSPTSDDDADSVNGVAAEVDGRDFVLYLAAGDRLAPDALFHVATAAWRDPLVDVVSWDDDRVDRSGRRSDPRFRPSWSPDTLLAANYLDRSFAIRARRLVVAGGLRTGLGDARWWDLLLRAGLDASCVERIPRMLAHLANGRPCPDDVRSLAVVSEHLARTGLPAEAVLDGGEVRIRWRDDDLPPVTVVVPTRHNRPMLERCLPGLAGTDYPDLEVVVVDNGGRTDERERWYASSFPGLDLRVEWWDRPFNYSAVNNHGARHARGDVLVFLNDDTELVDPTWLRDLVGWARRPEIGVVGPQLLDGDGRIQHGGVVLGLGGFADHLFQGLLPGATTLLGPTTWYRNVLAVTAACLAVRRDLFERLGGFDERFTLCGSDVVLGLDAVIAGHRNVCTPDSGVRHLESATRGTEVPPADFFASYWRYQRWINAGDPYFSPNLSLEHREPRLRSPMERTPQERLSAPLGRPVKVFRQQSDAAEAAMLADVFRVTDADARAVRAAHAGVVGARPARTVNWFLPDLDSPFYGGYNTALRIADHLRRDHGVESRFVVWAEPNEAFFRSGVAAAFPGLADAPIVFHDASRAALARVPDADVSIATLWATAYSVAQHPGASRRFYLIQDFEPMFYPAGTLYALAEESYRLGLYGLCNTEHMAEVYRSRYGGRATSFTPAVDPTVFHAEGRSFDRTVDVPATVFVYARPGHWRNCWELASLALEELKDRLGDRVRIVTAGSWARPEDMGSGIEHLGLLDYRETGNLYRTVDVGVALTVSEHPSYLPLELMACGVPVVAFDNPAGHWILRNGENALLARRTVDSLRDAVERVVLDPELGRALAREGLRDIAARHASWDRALLGIYNYLGDPEGA